jgi:hypothetical protein
MSTCEKDFTKLSINIEGTNPSQIESDIYMTFYNDYYPTGLKVGESPNPMLNIKTEQAFKMINPIMKNSNPDEDFKLDMCVANKCVNKTSPMVMIDPSKKYNFRDILSRIDNKTIATCYNNVLSDKGPDNDSVIHKCSIGEYDKTIGKCIYTADFYFPHLKLK